MKPVACFILRAKNRPTEEEGLLLLSGYLIKNKLEVFLDFIAKEKLGDHALLAVSNMPDPSVDITSVFTDFIRDSQGGTYLDNPNRYKIERMSFESGNPPELTLMAVAYALDKQEQRGVTADVPVLARVIARGERWEALRRPGDAMQSYMLSLGLQPNNPELLFRLGRVQTQFPRYRAEALKNLKQALQTLPGRADVELAVGQCYLALADSEPFAVQGATREELREVALSHLEVAHRRDANDVQIREELRQLHRRLSLEEKEDFFDQQ